MHRPVWGKPGGNGIGSGLEKWITFRLRKWRWSTCMMERKEWPKVGIVIVNHSPENKQLIL